MEEENAGLDVEFIKSYLKSSIELETQKRIAEKTFNELVQEEKQWKQKMSYVARKQYTSFSIIDMIAASVKGFGLSMIIMFVLLLIAEHVSMFIQAILVLVIFATVVMLVIVFPIYKKIKDYNSIRTNFILDQQKEKDIKKQGENALYVIQNNQSKLKQAYKHITHNLTTTYSANIIYKKYQTVEACAAFLDYLESGRCYTLEGPYGAYNKYEDDLAKGNIIKRLEEISSKMDVIIANQEKVYYVLQDIEKSVSEMKSDISFICNSLQNVDKNLQDIANNTKISAWASAVIATQVPDWEMEAQNQANKIYV